MLEEYLKTTHTNNGTGYPKAQYKAFNVNMDYKKNVRTLHCNSDFIGSRKEGKIEIISLKGTKLPYKKCQYEKSAFVFIPFDTLEDVEQFEQQENVKFRRCGNCFPPEMR